MEKMEITFLVKIEDQHVCYICTINKCFWCHACLKSTIVCGKYELKAISRLDIGFDVEIVMFWTYILACNVTMYKKKSDILKLKNIHFITEYCLILCFVIIWIENAKQLDLNPRTALENWKVMVTLLIKHLNMEKFGN